MQLRFYTVVWGERMHHGKILEFRENMIEYTILECFYSKKKFLGTDNQYEI